MTSVLLNFNEVLTTELVPLQPKNKEREGKEAIHIYDTHPTNFTTFFFFMVWASKQADMNMYC